MNEIDEVVTFVENRLNLYEKDGRTGYEHSLEVANISKTIVEEMGKFCEFKSV
jgi:HD superfamily phosphodiesterase